MKVINNKSEISLQKLENAKSVRNTSNCLKIYLYDNERTFFVGVGGGWGLI